MNETQFEKTNSGSDDRRENKPNGEIVITKLLDTDCAQVVSMERQYFSDPWSTDDFLYGIDDKNYYSVAARSGDTVLGYAVTVSAADESELLNICVDEKYRRQGIARKILGDVYRHAKEAGAATMYLEVRESNTSARTLYISEGFTEVGVRKWYYTKPAEHAIIMVKKFE